MTVFALVTQLTTFHVFLLYSTLKKDLHGYVYFLCHVTVTVFNKLMFAPQFFLLLQNISFTETGDKERPFGMQTGF